MPGLGQQILTAKLVGEDFGPRKEHGNLQSGAAPGGRRQVPLSALATFPNHGTGCRRTVRAGSKRPGA